MTTEPATILSDFVAGLPPAEQEAVRTYLEMLSTIEPSRQRRLEARDDAIRASFACYDGLSPSAAAKALAADLSRYLGAGWPREAHLTELPETASRLRHRLHLICRLNDGRALAWRQLLNIHDGWRTP